MMHSRTDISTRTITLNAGALPTSFRLFKAGINETENGTFLFDAKAAAMVMANYRSWGVDLAIDLEHQMLDVASTDPTSRDARGWFRLELRSDGSLWACGVRWTPDGAARLTDKRQRYVSPAFEVDPETLRIIKIVNCAITSIPATHHTPALVAASRTTMSMQTPPGMTPPATPPNAGGADPSATKTQLLTLLGLPSTATAADATAAVTALYQACDPNPAVQASIAKRLGISSRDLARLRSKKIDPVKYAQTRDAIARNSVGGKR